MFARNMSRQPKLPIYRWFGCLLIVLAGGVAARAGMVTVRPGIHYECTLHHAVSLNSPGWIPTEPLPLSLSDAVAAARRQLSTVASDARDWLVYDITLWHLLRQDDRMWY